MDPWVRVGADQVHQRFRETEADRDAWFANIQDLCDKAASLGLRIGMETDSNMLPTAKIGGPIASFVVAEAPAAMRRDTRRNRP